MRRRGFKICSFHLEVDASFRELNRKRDSLRRRQGFLASPRSALQGRLVRSRQGIGCQPGLGKNPLHQCAVIVVTAQSGIATGNHHFKNPLRQSQDGNVKCSTTQIVDGEHALAGVIEAIRDGCGGGLADQAQHIESGQLRRVFGRLSLRFVEISGNGNHRAVDVVAEGVFGAITQGRKNFSTDLDRALLPGNGLQRDHAGLIDEQIRQLRPAADIGDTPAHQAFHR